MDTPFHQFNSQTYGQLSFDEVVNRMLEYMEVAPGMAYELIIGTDSLLYSNHKAEFVSAIVVHRKRSGGIYFWSKRQETHMYDLRQRIFQEALLSLRLAEQLIEKLKNLNVLDFNLSIHVDVGPNGETKKMVNEIVGMIKGSGFDVKTKPDSYGASSVADRHT
ncbi:MAG TPA: ribonuclease H-like YkuK family protein [Candidatus Binatia bacterium]|nr:ribonuclease H-like YkuK family protein [Candidatus Binatia bacterium]